LAIICSQEIAVQLSDRETLYTVIYCMAVDSVGSIVTFQETIDFGGKRHGFDFDFLAPIISDGRMYRRRIDVAIFVLSIGTISAGHNEQLRRRASA